MTLPAHRIEEILETACDAAAKQTLPLFRSRIGVDNKHKTGFDPVTEADKSAERAIRAVIESACPDHAIEGEEYGLTRADAPFRWIIDPIDGTRAFISGLPVWGTLIGLYENGVPVAGIMDQPFTKERCMAVPSQPTRFKSPRQAWAQVHTAPTSTLADATLMTTAPELLNDPADQPWLTLKDDVRLVRYGCDCYAFMLLACGQIDIAIESGLQAYDIAALIPLIRQAGGCVTTWEGGDPARGGRVVASANRALHEQALERLKP